MGVLMREQRGMSLVEVLLALAILAFVLLSVAALFSEAISLNATGMDYTAVNSLARDRLEELLSMRWNDPSISIPGWVSGDNAILTVDDTSTLPPGSPFTREYEVRTFKLSKTQDLSTWQDQLTTPVGPNDGNIKQITVIVNSSRLPHTLLGRRETRVSAFKCNGLL
jgi:prepilin-type N-terminal cleavage/methylation domain-containing protein